MKTQCYGKITGKMAQISNSFHSNILLKNESTPAKWWSKRSEYIFSHLGLLRIWVRFTLQFSFSVNKIQADKTHGAKTYIRLDSTRFRFNQHKQFLPAVYCAQIRTCAWKGTWTHTYTHSHTHTHTQSPYAHYHYGYIIECCVTVKCKRGYTNFALL